MKSTSRSFYKIYKFKQVIMTGTIKRLMDKGYGFISSEELDKDIFFHSSALVDVEFNDLREGDQVTFETQETEKGMNAVNVAKA